MQCQEWVSDHHYSVWRKGKEIGLQDWICMAESFIQLCMFNSLSVMQLYFPSVYRLVALQIWSPANLQNYRRYDFAPPAYVQEYIGTCVIQLSFLACMHVCMISRMWNTSWLLMITSLERPHCSVSMLELLSSSRRRRGWMKVKQNHTHAEHSCTHVFTPACALMLTTTRLAIWRMWEHLW